MAHPDVDQLSGKVVLGVSVRYQVFTLFFPDASSEVQACVPTADDTQKQKWISQEMVELGVQT